MAGRILSKYSPTLGRILWGEKWASTMASAPLSSGYQPHVRSAISGHMKQKVCCSFGKLFYGEKWIWRQQFFVPRNSNDVKKGLFQIKAERHFKNLHGADLAAVRDKLQGKVDDAQKYVKVVVDTGKLFSSPLQVAAVALTNSVLIKTSLEYMKPGSAIKKIDNMTESARKKFEESEEQDKISGDAGSGSSDE